MLHRYVIREVLKPSLIVCGLFVVLFAGFSWITFLGKAVDALLPMSMLFTLIALKVGIALEVLLPISLYFGVILGVGRLYSDSEMKALMACGVSPYRVLGTIFLLSSCVAIFVAIFSLYLRPLAYEQSYQLKAKGEAGLGISHLEAGHFYERRDGALVLFAEGVNQQSRQLERVFVQSEHGDSLRIILAAKAVEKIDPQTGSPIPVLYDGFEYKFPRKGAMAHMAHFSQLSIFPREAIAEYRRKAISTQELSLSNSRKDFAELQWRFSAPFSTVLLSLLGMLLSRSSPRQGKYAKIFTATVVFAVYYFLGVMVKTFVEQGTMPVLPGLWWMVIGLGILVSVGLLSPKFSVSHP